MDSILLLGLQDGSYWYLDGTLPLFEPKGADHERLDEVSILVIGLRWIPTAIARIRCTVVQHYGIHRIGEHGTASLPTVQISESSSPMSKYGPDGGCP